MQEVSDLMANDALTNPKSTIDARPKTDHQYVCGVTDENAISSEEPGFLNVFG